MKFQFYGINLVQTHSNNPATAIGEIVKRLWRTKNYHPLSLNLYKRVPLAHHCIRLCRTPMLSAYACLALKLAHARYMLASAMLWDASISGDLFSAVFVCAPPFYVFNWLKSYSNASLACLKSQARPKDSPEI